MPWRPIVTTTPPAAEPVSLAEAKAQTRIDGSDSDVELGIYIKAAREYVEAYTGLRLITQTALLRCSCFGDLARLPTAPIGAVSSIAYLDVDGVEQTMSADIYETVLIGLEPGIRLRVGQSWPSRRNVRDSVRVTAACGFGTASADVPAPLRQAMLLLIGDWIANREATNVANIVNSLPNSFENLLVNYRLAA